MGCGRVESQGLSALNFLVTKFPDLVKIIIPFFKKYPFRGSKAKDFIDLVKVLELIKNKSHLTDGGIQEIVRIKSGMNSLRKS